MLNTNGFVSLQSMNEQSFIKKDLTTYVNLIKKSLLNYEF